jgi:hypothetical protein
MAPYSIYFLNVFFGELLIFWINMNYNHLLSG